MIETLYILIVKTPTIKSVQYDCWYGKTGIEFIFENHSVQQIRVDLGGRRIIKKEDRGSS